MIFEWDKNKSDSNLKKHGISFEEARFVFMDPLSLTVSDPEHSDAEYRFIDIGISDKKRLLVVVYVERSKAIRIISARQALPAERKCYEESSY